MIDPRKEVELVGQAFKEQPSGKTARVRGRKHFLWHINQDHDTMALDQNKYTELEVAPVQKNDQMYEKDLDQN